MGMSIKYLFMALVCSAAFCLPAASQNADRRDVRRGNRDFRKEDYKAAEIDYRKALVKDSTSFAAGYNLGNTLYRMEDREQAGKIYERLKETADASPYAADYYYNVGNVVAGAENWQAAVDAYRQALLRNPSDMDAKENYIYAKQKLKDQQNQQDQQNQDNQDNKENQDQQNQDNQNRDDRNDQDDNQNQNQNNQDQNQDRNDGQGQQGQQPKITPQAAQQMLQAIQAKEKETQDKVNKEKAQVLKSRQKEKNW